MNVAQLRLRAQHLAAPTFRSAHELVRSLGAVQAQDYLGALWAVGLRLRDATEPDIERALAERTILRTWPMRNTLHFVASEDARWMIALIGPRMIKRHTRRLAELGVDAATLALSRKVLARALRDGRQLTRPAIYQALEAGKVSTAGQRGIHILGRISQDGLICFGAREGKQQTFVLLEEWAPHAKLKPRDEALAELALRYFTGHGPATLRDFVWWSSLAPADAKLALASVASQLERERVGDEACYWRPHGRATRTARAHLLPAFDEYLVAYRDRSAVLADPRAVNAGGGMLAPAMVVNGRVIGTWRRTLGKRDVSVELLPLGTLSREDRRALDAPAAAFGAFLGRPVSIVERQRAKAAKSTRTTR